jgi:trehalose 6-phosphate phosphatase
VERLHPVGLSPEQIALFLDVDGTLLDIASRPEAVSVPYRLRESLAAAEDRLGGALALVSGRPIAGLDRLFDPLRLPASGVHGAEIRDAPDAPVVALISGRLPEDAWGDLNRLLDDFTGTFAENKAVSFAVHYRGAPIAPEALAAALQRFIAVRAELGLRLTAGLCVFEVTLPGFDKGKAIERFMATEPFAGRTPVFIADDELDGAGFDAVLTRGGRAFSVGAALPGLSGSFVGPEAVRGWLDRLSR